MFVKCEQFDSNMYYWWATHGVHTKEEVLYHRGNIGQETTSSLPLLYACLHGYCGYISLPCGLVRGRYVVAPQCMLPEESKSQKVRELLILKEGLSCLS